MIPKDIKGVTEKRFSSLREHMYLLLWLEKYKKYELKKSDAAFLLFSLEARLEALGWCPSV